MIKHGLTSSNILRSLPDVLKHDKKTYALASSIADVLATRPLEIDLTRIYAQIDELPEDLLDILAHDFKVDWYGYNYPLSVKRAQFKASFQVRKKLGTPGAMELALQSIYPHTEVQEWFDYGGNPYCFQVVLDISGPQVSLSHEDTLRNINWYKNKRSHLDGIIFRSRGDFELGLTTGYVVYSMRLCGTYPVRATQGEITDHNVVMFTGADGLAYSTPLTDENLTGTHPEVATRGWIYNQEVELKTYADGEVYKVPTTGTKPDISTQGKFDKKGLSVGEESQGATYQVKYCGSGLGNLM